MRSSRALHLLRRFPAKPSKYALTKKSCFPRPQRFYCSSCQSTPDITVHATTNPPTPAADHRQLAVEQELFTTSIHSPGTPLFLPNGARIFNKLTAFLRAQYINFGFEEVITPTIYKKELWEKSGHWENYADDMFSVTSRRQPAEEEEGQIGKEEEYGLKPMNCPGHCLLFAAGPQRSYREMPVRYADFSPLHRNEISGALSGLTRVRRFHQDDAHIFCRPSQIGDEISRTLDFVEVAYKTFRLGSYKLALSTRPKDHFIGTTEEWDRAEDALREALDKSGQEWILNEGDGAFYGPKIDIILKDSDSKEHQTATIQLDFQLPKRFDLGYLAPAPELERKGLSTTDPGLLATNGKVTPVIIHRAILGSVERFMALLIEHYNGRWPFWLSPRQAVIVTVSDDASVVRYAHDVASNFALNKSLHKSANEEAIKQEKLEKQTWSLTPRPLHQSDIRIDIDDSPRSLKKKILEAKQKHYNVIMVVGKRNIPHKTVNIDFSGILGDEGNVERMYNALVDEEVAPREGGISVSKAKEFLEVIERGYY